MTSKSSPRPAHLPASGLSQRDLVALSLLLCSK
jgi:hypothetical protein